MEMDPLYPHGQPYNPKEEEEQKETEEEVQKKEQEAPATQEGLTSSQLEQIQQSSQIEEQTAQELQSRETKRQKTKTEEKKGEEEGETTAEIVNNMKKVFSREESRLTEDLSIKELYQTSEELAYERLTSGEIVDTKEIEAIYSLFFNTISFQEFLTQPSMQSPDPVKPPAAYVFQRLYSCIEAFDTKGLKNCEQCMKAVKTFKKSADEQVKRMLSRPDLLDATIAEMGEQHEAVIKFRQYQETLSQFPLLLAKEALGGTNVNETYVLRNNEGQTQWIFKPEQEFDENLKGYSQRSTAKANIGKVECAASLVNFEQKFPIPLTVYVDIKGWLGSAQFYLEDVVSTSEMLEKNLPVSEEDLQKLVIFDLLFMNCDRHKANLLFKQSEDKYQAYGIDHDQCMGEGNQGLKLEYLAFEVFNKLFNPNLVEELISDESIKKYEEKMALFGFKDGKKWMKDAVVVYIKKAIEENKTIKETVEDLKEEWEQSYM